MSEPLNVAWPAEPPSARVLPAARPASPPEPVAPGADGDYGLLLVDDHEDNLFALEQALTPLGRRMFRAGSGEQALRCVLREKIAVVVMDLLLPGMDGLETVTYLRRLEHTRLLPVVLVTGVGRDDAVAERAYRLGVGGFLLKPIDPWSLRTHVRALAELYVHARHSGTAGPSGAGALPGGQGRG
ncbi:two-component system response regulator [Streptomyces sp. NPDC017940]|uniref:two-component system response regulator n=1 Tax=Streptomyces sp. NPDC017940 TaxID=3365017 RepID=UPI0037AE9819